MLDVTSLVQQMQQTLSAIHEILISLDDKVHDAGLNEKLDSLEAERDSILSQLQMMFEKESEELAQKRKMERDQMMERRRMEDEEIATKRQAEDDEYNARIEAEDSERGQKFEAEKKDVEDDTDDKMEKLEEEAERKLDEDHKRLSELEDKRQVSKLERLGCDSLGFSFLFPSLSSPCVLTCMV